MFASWAERIQKWKLQPGLIHYINAGKADELVVNKDSTITKKLQKLQLNCSQVLSGKKQKKNFFSSIKEESNENLKQFYVEAQKMNRTVTVLP